MPLSRALDADKIISASVEHSAKRHGKNVHHLLEKESNSSESIPRYETSPLPKYQIPHKGVDGDTAYSLIHNELLLDGIPFTNLASFVHTYMPPQADKLMIENMSKNLIDQDEYPATTEIHTRCVSMLAHLWHADKNDSGTGTATTGSSEAIMLGGLAMKKLWQQRTIAAGRDERRPGPNVIMGSNAQVAIEKFARYFDVECRLVPVSKESNYCLDPKKAMDFVDENTIGVFVILGSTYTGHYEPVKEMADLLDDYEAKTGISVPIHVDAASGGYVAPFATPDHLWDFKIPRVVSINSSAHKFGKVYVGLGWVIWRDSKHLPKDLIFELHYLGSVEYSFSLNFSRPAAQVITQYFNFIHLGFEKYRSIALNDAKNARLLSRALENSKYYEVVSNIHRPKTGVTLVDKAVKAAGLSDDIDYYNPGLPVVAFKFSAEFVKEYPHVEQKWIQTLLRAKGQWIVPNYALPPNLEKEEILRVVIREQFSEDLVERLVTNIIEVTEGLMQNKSIATPGGKELMNSMHAGANSNPAHSKHEKSAASHVGESTRATGHDSIC